MKIQILGTGCTKCTKLAENAQKAAEALALNVEIEKITDIREIMRFQVIMTPGLAINGDVKAVGKVLSPDEIKELLD